MQKLPSRQRYHVDYIPRQKVKRPNSFSYFIRQGKIALAFAFLVILVTFFPKLRYENFATDTELMMRYPDDTLNWWLELGRYGLVALKKVLPYGTGIHIRLMNVLTYLLFFVATVLLLYIFDIVNRSSRNQVQNRRRLTLFEKMLAVGLFITSPIVLEQTNFILQSVEVNLGLVLTLLGFILFKKSVAKYTVYRKSIYVLAVCATTFSFSVYPSLVLGFISVTVGYIFLQSLKFGYTLRTYATKILYYVTGSVLSYGLYYGGKLLILHFTKLKASDYLMDTSRIKNFSADNFFGSIVKSFRANFLSDTPFLLWALLALFAVCVVFILCARPTLTGGAIGLITIFGFLFTALFSFGMLGWIGPIRSLYPTYPILLCVFCHIIFYVWNGTSFGSLGFKLPFCALLLGLMVMQGKNTYTFGMQEQEIFEKEIRLTERFKELLKEEGVTDYSAYKLAVFGEIKPEKELKGDSLGQSFFLKNPTSPLGATARGADFLYTQGMDFKKIKLESYAEALAQVSDMKYYPHKSCVKVTDDVVILRLGK